MALATFELRKCTGTNAATETASNNHPCYISADIHTEDFGDYPVAAPKLVSSPDSFSYETWLRLVCTAPPDNYTQNFLVWGPPNQPDYLDSPGNKITAYIGTTPTGATPTINQSTVATTSQHDNHYSEGTALDIDVIPGDDRIDAVGEKTDFWVQQAKLEFAVKQGNMISQVYNYQYEEV